VDPVLLRDGVPELVNVALVEGLQAQLLAGLNVLGLEGVVEEGGASALELGAQVAALALLEEAGARLAVPHRIVVIRDLSL